MINVAITPMVISFWVLCGLATAFGLTGMYGAVAQWQSAGLLKIIATAIFTAVGIGIPIVFGPTLPNIVLGAGMILVLVADYALSYVGTSEVFLYGMVAFMLGYAVLAGSAGTAVDWSTVFAHDLVTKVLVLLAILGISAGVFSQLNAMGGNTGVVVVYFVVQIALVYLAFLTGNPWAFLGAILLYTSDAVIGLHMFSTKIAFGQAYQFIIMPTYYVGLTLFLRGAVLR